MAMAYVRCRLHVLRPQSVGTQFKWRRPQTLERGHPVGHESYKFTASENFVMLTR